MTGSVWDKIGDILAAQGLAGIVILFLGYAVVRLYNRNQELHDTLYTVGRESVKANESTAAALNKLSDLVIRIRPE